MTNDEIKEALEAADDVLAAYGGFKNEYPITATSDIIVRNMAIEYAVELARAVKALVEEREVEIARLRIVSTPEILTIYNDGVLVSQHKHQVAVEITGKMYNLIVREASDETKG